MKYVLKILFCMFLFSSFPFFIKAEVVKKKQVLTTKIVVKRTKQERIDLLVKIARAYKDEGEPKEAVKAYEKILEIDPTLIRAKYVISQLYILAKEEKKAEQTLLELIKKFPNDPKLWNNLAWLYATSEDLTFRNGEKALNAAHQALVLSPNDYHVWDTLSEAYYISGKYKKAYRAAKQMAMLAIQHGDKITKKQLKEYNQHIRKCKRACEIAQEEKKAKKDAVAENTNAIPKKILLKKQKLNE